MPRPAAVAGPGPDRSVARTGSLDRGHDLRALICAALLCESASILAVLGRGSVQRIDTSLGAGPASARRFRYCGGGGSRSAGRCRLRGLRARLPGSGGRAANTTHVGTLRCPGGAPPPVRATLGLRCRCGLRCRPRCRWGPRCTRTWLTRVRSRRRCRFMAVRSDGAARDEHGAAHHEHRYGGEGGRGAEFRRDHRHSLSHIEPW